MAGELLQPGIHIHQVVTAPSVSVLRPALAACVVGPAFEVIPVLKADNSINANAKWGLYSQLPKSITHLQFPDHRKNIAQLSILSETVKVFMGASGLLEEMKHTNGSAFLCSHHGSGKAAFRSASFGGGLALNGKVLTFCLDNPVPGATDGDISILFSKSSTFSASDAAEQINAVVAGCATVHGTSVQIASPSFGALSSVTIREGSANALLGLGWDSTLLTPATVQERVVGSGWRGQDQNIDNVTKTSWIEYFVGSYSKTAHGGADFTSSTFPATAGIIPSSDTTQFVENTQAPVVFGDAAGKIPLKIGDYIYADGQRLMGGEVMRVEPTRFRLGAIDDARSVADENGNYTTIYRNPVEVGNIYDLSPWAPKYMWFKANNLNWQQLAPTADYAKGSNTGTAATQGSVESLADITEFSLAGFRLHYVLTVDGVQTDAYFTFESSYADVASIAAAISIPGVAASAVGSKLVLKTAAYGRLQSITVKGDAGCTAYDVLKFRASTSDPKVDVTGTGTDVEFKWAPASVTSGTLTIDSTNYKNKTLVLATSADHGGTWTTHSYAFPSSDTVFTSVDDVVSVVSAISGFSSLFEIAAGTTTVTFSTLATGYNVGIKLDTSTSAELKTFFGSAPQTAGYGVEGLNGSVLKFSFDSNPHLYAVSFNDDSLDLAIEDINTIVGVEVAAKYGENKIQLTSPLKGLASSVTVVASGGATSLGLSDSENTNGGRPYPDVYADVDGTLHVQAEILRSVDTGAPLNQTDNNGVLYIQYKALRLDVSPRAANPGIIRLSDTALLSTVLDPISTDNPLALGLFLAMINAPTAEVKGLGIDEVTAAAPTGTTAAWGRAAGMLEAEEVYAIAPLTHDDIVISMWGQHATTMSSPDGGGERIVISCPTNPTRQNSTIAVSGTAASTTDEVNQVLLDTNPASGLIAAGVPTPLISIAESQEVYIQLVVNEQVRRYSVSGVTGALVNVRTSFTSDINTAGFYSTVLLDTQVVGSAYTLAKRGGGLTIPGTDINDYSLIAETVAGANEAMGNHRLVSVFPDTVITTINGTDFTVPGYYACACIAGMCSGQSPQQGFTNLPITGLTGVVGTEKFTKRQLNIMAGGGTYILMQEGIGGPIVCRQQVTTDTSSIEMRELSITRVLDMTAKLMRLGLRKYIGVNNITDMLLNNLSTVAHAVLRYEEEAGILIAGNLTKIFQSTTSKDTVYVRVRVTPPYPCNDIDLTIEI